MHREPGLVGIFRRTAHWQFHAYGGHHTRLWRLQFALEVRTRPILETHLELGLGPLWFHGSIGRQG